MKAISSIGSFNIFLDYILFKKNNKKLFLFIPEKFYNIINNNNHIKNIITGKSSECGGSSLRLGDKRFP